MRWDERDADLERREVEPWLVAYKPAVERDRVHRDRIASLNCRCGYALDPTCVVATDAHVVASSLVVGEHSTIASGCVVRGDVRIGAHSSLNAGAVTIGRVTIGNGVRIAGYAVLVGEDHVFEQLDVPIALQGLTSDGVVIDDDVWIGANVTVVDGVRIGAHSVVAAGAVVTRDVPDWSVVAGVPARILRDRRDAAPSAVRAAVSDPLDRLAERAAQQWPDVLKRCQVRNEGITTYVDTPRASWGPRALNDAVEIAGAFGALPPGHRREDLIERIAAQQEPVTGMFVDPSRPPAWFARVARGESVEPAEVLRPSHDEWETYGIISCGYALEVLGSTTRAPVHVVEAVDANTVGALLEGLDWSLLAWPSGSWIDGIGTALSLNRRHHGSRATMPVLWGWLTAHVDPRTGMWGSWLPPQTGLDVGWLMAVNGYYRMVRGTFAQFGIDLPHPERAIDTVLAHARANEWFTRHDAAGRARDAHDPFNARNACNVLDVVHPLWLLNRQRPDYRVEEIRDAMAGVVREVCDDWVDGAGCPWQVGRDEPGLQGTEMWLSIAYLAADVLGVSGGLPWEPRGVHRLAPVDTLP